jgi:hypothetical protein
MRLQVPAPYDRTEVLPGLVAYLNWSSVWPQTYIGRRSTGSALLVLPKFASVCKSISSKRLHVEHRKEETLDK